MSSLSVGRAVMHVLCMSLASELIFSKFPGTRTIECLAVDDTLTGRHKNLLSQSDHLESIRRFMHEFKNKTLIVSIVVREPFVIFNEPSEWSTMSERERQNAAGDLDNYGGVAIEVMKRLKAIFKFNTVLTRPADNQFGIYLADSNRWTGMMGQLVNREVDVGLTALSITLSRAQAVDFSRAYFVETASILIRTPEEIQNYLAIFEPFSRDVWFILLATILTLILLITIMTKLEDSQRKQEKQHKLVKFIRNPSAGSVSKEGNDSNSFSADVDDNGSLSRVAQANARRFSRNLNRRLSELARVQKQHEFGDSWLDRFYYAVTCVINILLIRDIRNPPHPTAIRILVCIWWLSTIVIVNIYLGILFGQLVVPRRPKSIETLEELVNQNQIQWAVTTGSSIYDLFRQSDPNSIYGQLGRRMKNVSSADEGVQQVLESNWAYIRERSILTFKVAQQHNNLKACKMQFGREDFYSVGFGIGLAKNSSYTRPFNSALTLMIENGLISRFQSMYWPRRNEYTECHLIATEGQPLTIKHFLSIYLVAFTIIGVSAILLVYQNFHEHLFSKSGICC